MLRGRFSNRAFELMRLIDRQEAPCEHIDHDSAWSGTGAEALRELMSLNPKELRSK